MTPSNLTLTAEDPVPTPSPLDFSAAALNQMNSSQSSFSPTQYRDILPKPPTPHQPGTEANPVTLAQSLPTLIRIAQTASHNDQLTKVLQATGILSQSQPASPGESTVGGGLTQDAINMIAQKRLNHASFSSLRPIPIDQLTQPVNISIPNQDVPMDQEVPQGLNLSSHSEPMTTGDT